MDEPLAEHESECEYDLEAIYDAEIGPLMAQIIAICKRHELPMIASFAYRTGSFCSTVLHFDDRQVERFEQMQKILLAGTHETHV